MNVAALFVKMVVLVLMKLMVTNVIVLRDSKEIIVKLVIFFSVFTVNIILIHRIMKSYFSAESLYAKQKKVKKQAFYLYVFLCLMHGIKQKMLFFQNKQIRLSVPIRVIWLGFSLFFWRWKIQVFFSNKSKPLFFQKNMILWFFRKANKREILICTNH